MEIIKQIAVIGLICLGGEYVSFLLPIPIPGSIIGLLILLALFALKILKEDFFGKTGEFLLANLGLFFIPAGVSLISVAHLITDYVVQISIVVVVSTILTFAATAYTVKLVCYLQKKAGKVND